MMDHYLIGYFLVFFQGSS